MPYSRPRKTARRPWSGSELATLIDGLESGIFPHELDLPSRTRAAREVQASRLLQPGFKGLSLVQRLRLRRLRDARLAERTQRCIEGRARRREERNAGCNT